jgi:hypothetical protein
MITYQRIGVTEYRRSCCNADTPTRTHAGTSREAGQATTEMVFVIPILLTLAAAAMAVVYMCWQGVKVQEVANLAARIQGQERVAGGVDFATIQQDNGVNLGGDIDPTKSGQPLDSAGYQALQQRQSPHPPPNTVYGKILKLVKDQFGPGEPGILSVPPPKYGLVGYSDQVKVVRVWQPPKFFWFDVPLITVQATAYGGEDPHAYGLVRWGHTTSGGGGSPFWAEQGSGPNGQQYNTLPNPNHD